LLSVTNPVGGTELDFEIVLDLSRLLSRVLHSTPTGVDRCELAYARGLMAAVPDSLSFGAVHPYASYGRLRRSAVLQFLDETERRWRHIGHTSAWERRRFAAGALLKLRPRPVPQRSARHRIYLQASPNNLVNRDRVQKILVREQAKFVCLIHDLIPVQFPEYARPGGAADHVLRIQTVTALADAIITNSEATGKALRPFIDGSGRRPILAAAPLGTEPPTSFVDKPPERPYFVCIGTIEPRKNHLLLLHLWRKMSEKAGSGNIPRLVIIGRRGWENEQVIDMLERCVALKGCVEEYNGLHDLEVQRLLYFSKGLLLPSFAEGYGMPVSEAIALGVPVICSDLPALREAGGHEPIFLDPLDGSGWERAIETLAARPWQALRTVQSGATVPADWSKHIATVLDVVQKLIAVPFSQGQVLKL
jgi:glycosyltransferase involved in cell wall biosynthesis